MKSKILLVLDIDETLIYAIERELNYSPDFEVSFYKIYKRPGLDDFLKSVSSKFEVGFWSSASNNYVKTVVHKLTKNIFQPSFIWGRSRCSFEIEKNNSHQLRNRRESHYNYVKKLSRLSKNLSHPLDQIMIIDDTPHKSKYNKENAILINSWKGNRNDNELEILSNYLCLNYKKKNIIEFTLYNRD